MFSEIKPAIILVGYNRPDSLKRLLKSVLDAHYPQSGGVHLIISLDYCENQSKSQQIQELVEKVEWRHGDIQIIKHEERLGLRNHIIFCGDLTEQYEEVIVLEDDLCVSREFYSYAAQALSFYSNIPVVAGISLYCHHSIPFLFQPFYPLVDDYDVYFLQFASSWGQAWNKRQWEEFKDWYIMRDVAIDEHFDDFLPDEVNNWPESSWLKQFVAYMVQNDKLFVYPRLSLTTNFGDVGMHYRSVSHYFQTPMRINDKSYKFVDPDDSLSVYDSFFQIKPSILYQLCPSLDKADFTVDLGGNKNTQKIFSKYILTTQKSINHVKSFGNRMRPDILNVVFDIEGHDILLCKTSDVIQTGENEKMTLEPNMFGRFKIDYLLFQIRYLLAKRIMSFAKFLQPK